MDTDFRVIIVGGSIAGLTLSHCLNAAGIDNIVLEKHGEITSQVGASIGVLPNGGTILDQLGIFHRIEKLIEPLRAAHISYPDGFTLTLDYPVIVKERFGRPMAFLSRQELIEVLYTSFEDTSHIHVKQRVNKIRQEKDRVHVITDDGTTYEGDLVVGADGVHSKVRSEMWSFANSPHLGKIALQEHKGLTVEFSCIFGISSAVPGLEIGEQVASFHDGLTIMTYQGLGGRVYWFVVQKLDRKHKYPHLPRFSQQDAIDACERLGGVWLRNAVHFRDVWANRETFAMTPLEECVLQPWHSDRIVCIGDSIHKMTPNLGQGANLAIEDAAELANGLHDMVMRRGNVKPTSQEMQDLLESFQRKHLGRVKHVCDSSAFLARVHARQGLFYTILGRYVSAYFPNIPADMISTVCEGAAVLDYLPIPYREATGWQRMSKATVARLAAGIVTLCALGQGAATTVNRHFHITQVINCLGVLQ